MKDLRESDNMAAEQLMREQERRELQHMVASSVPSSPFGGLAILNPATLRAFGNEHRALISAHLFANYGNPEARFQIPIPIPIAVSSPGPQIYTTQATPSPQIDIISSWVNDQKEKKKRGNSNWEKTNKKNEIKDSKKEKVKDNNGLKSTIIPTTDIHKNNNHENLSSNQPSRDKQFTCHVCNRGFGYKHVLQNHERTHTGEKPFECTICQKKFTRDHHLKTHLRLHTGEKPYQCTSCDRQFVQVANLRRHLRVHTGEKPYPCDVCKNKFSDSNQLKAHMLIHKGEKPFACTDCEGRFRRRHHLLNHKCNLNNSVSPPNGQKRERKSRQTRRIIRIETVGSESGGGPMDFLPGIPEQTQPEDLSTHSLNFSSHSSCSASPSPQSGGSGDSIGVYSIGSSDHHDYSTDEEKMESEASPSHI